MTPIVTRTLSGAATVAVAVGAAVGSVTSEPLLVIAAALASIAVGAGWIVAHHEPRLAVGPALTWTSASVVLVSTVGAIGETSIGPEPLPGAFLAATVSAGIWPLNLAGFLALLLVFPDGPRRGWLAPTSLGLFVIGAVLVVLGLWGLPVLDGSVAVSAGADPSNLVLPIAGAALVGAALILAVATVLVRYRHSGVGERLQLRWLLLAGGAVVALLFAGWVLAAVSEGRLPLAVTYSPFLFATIVGVPCAVTIAIVRHDLFDIDRILSTSITWALTLIFSATVFAAVVIGIGQLLHAATSAAPAIAAFLAALLLLPLYRTLNAAVGRVIDRDLFVAVVAVEQFVAHVRAGRREPEEVEGVLRAAQGDDGLTLVLADSDGGWMSITGATPAPNPVESGRIAVRAGTETIAQVMLRRDSARARTRAVRLAETAYMPIEVSRLRLALRRSLQEAEASRTRIARAAADERRRIERDLHDGVQQRIIATGMRLRRVEPSLGPAQAAELDRAVDELLGVVAELRRLANGVWPSRLDDGLDAALAALRETTPLPVDLRIGALPGLDPARAAAAYFLVAEAVANCLKHAHASGISVSVDLQAGGLTIVVSDDGVGLPKGTVLPGLSDRAESAGGTLEIAEAPGGGTTITAVI